MLPAVVDRTDSQISFWTTVAGIIDTAERAVDALEKTEKPGAPLVRVYRGMILGQRAIVSWRLGKPQEALELSLKLLAMGTPPPGPKLAYLLGYSYALQVTRMMGKIEELQKGLPILEADAPMFPMLHMMADELKRPYRTEDYMKPDLQPPPIVRSHPYQQLFAAQPPPISAIRPMISNLMAEADQHRLASEEEQLARLRAPTPPIEQVTSLVSPSWSAPPPPPLSPETDAVIEAVHDYFGNYVTTSPSSFEHSQSHFSVPGGSVSPLEAWPVQPPQLQAE